MQCAARRAMSKASRYAAGIFHRGLGYTSPSEITSIPRSAAHRDSMRVSSMTSASRLSQLLLSAQYGAPMVRSRGFVFPASRRESSAASAPSTSHEEIHAHCPIRMVGSTESTAARSSLAYARRESAIDAIYAFRYLFAPPVNAFSAKVAGSIVSPRRAEISAT